MIIFEPESAQRLADMHYERLLAEATKQRKLKLLPATSAPTWRLRTALRQLAIGFWRRFITSRFDSHGSQQQPILIQSK